MSDETRQSKEWLAPDPQDDTVEERRANELEAFLATALTRGLARSARSDAGDSMSQHDTHISEEWLASVLVGLGDEITPDSDFAADLQSQLEQHIRARNGSGTGGTAANGAIVSSDGQSQPPHETRPWRGVHRYRPFWAAMAALVLLAILLALPPVRASLRQPLCLGSVCIVGSGAPQPTAGAHGPATPTPLPSLLDLAGRTTLAQARAQATFPVRLPTYPSDLGQPEYVFLQNLDGAAVVLAWVERDNPGHVRMSLSEFSSGIYIYKFTSEPVAVTSVHGQQALWTTGPYMVQVQDGTYEQRRLVTGHALIWTEGSITYRLETTVSLDEAVRIAGSLR